MQNFKIDPFTKEKLGTEAKCEEVTLSEGSKIVEITGVPNNSKTVSILCRGSIQLVLDETERSLHDALCVVRSIVKKKAMFPGGSTQKLKFL